MATYRKLLKNKAGDTIIPVTEPLRAVEISLSDFISVASGFTITGYVYSIGNVVFGDIVIHKTSGTFTSTQSQVGTVKTDYCPLSPLNSYGVICGDEWGAASPCYFYVHNNGVMNIADKNNQSKAWAKASFKWVVS